MESGYLNGVPASACEVITHSLYDTLYLANRNYFEFFRVPLGAMGEGNKSKTLADTNMQMSSMMPKYNAFRVKSISVMLHLTPRRNQVLEDCFYRNGYVEFIIGCKVFVQTAPVGELARPLKERCLSIRFDIAASQVVASASVDGENPEPYTLTPNDLMLQPMQSFVLILGDIPAAVVKRHGKIVARLNGELIRTPA